MFLDMENKTPHNPSPRAAEALAEAQGLNVKHPFLLLV
jgi:hypothetical protein